MANNLPKPNQAVRYLMPEFFQRDRDGQNLLRQNEQNLVEEVFYETEMELGRREINTNNRALTEVDAQLLDDIVSVRENVVRVVDSLLHSSKARNDFLRNCPPVLKLRKDYYKALVAVAEAVKLDRKNSDIARLTGNCTGVVGAIVLGLGVVLAIPTAGVSTALSIAGASLMAAGGTCSAGTSLTEGALLKKNTKKANDILDKVAEESAQIQPWLVHSTRLTKSIENIRNINIAKQISDAVKDLVIEAIAVKAGQERRAVIKYIVIAAIQFIPSPFHASVQTVAMLISMVVALISLHERNRIVFDCAALTFRVFLGILTLLDSSIDIGVTIANIVAGSVSRAVGAAVIRGGFVALSLLIDSAMIVLTSIDIHHGSKSEEGEQILNGAKELNEQTKKLEELYNQLRRESGNYSRNLVRYN